MNIIGISGRAGSGKDTTAHLMQYLFSEFSNVKEECYCSFKKFKDTYGRFNEYNTFGGFCYSEWEQKAFSDKLKEIASILTGIGLQKFHDQVFKKEMLPAPWNMTARELLQKLGTDMMRKELGDDVWVNALFADYIQNNDFEPDSKWIITDVRFPNEAKAIKDRGGIMICVETGREDDGDDLHISERAMYFYQYDYILDNSGTIEQLQEKVKTMLQHFELLEK